jgi:hypothetical protein
MESHGGMILAGESRRTPRETCPSVTLSATNNTWTDPGANPGPLEPIQLFQTKSDRNVNLEVPVYF